MNESDSYAMAGFKISPSATLELNPPQQLRALTTRKIMNLMNISVADDHAKQRFGLFEHRYDLRPYLDNLWLFYWLSVEADSATTDAKINTTPAPALRVEPEKESDLIGETVYQPQISV